MGLADAMIHFGTYECDWRGNVMRDITPPWAHTVHVQTPRYVMVGELDLRPRPVDLVPNASFSYYFGGLCALPWRV